MNDDFIQRGIQHLKRQKATGFLVPEFADGELVNNGFQASGNIAAMPSVFVMPDFSDEPVTSPDGEFVSALSSPSVPICSGRGSGEPIGKLVTIQISASTDDGYFRNNSVFDDITEFGYDVPIA